MTYLYQKNNRYFAQVPGQMEALAEDELKSLGAVNCKVDYRGVYFEADKSALYRINYQSRLISRVLAPLISFSCHTPSALIKSASEIEWEKFFGVDKTFAITASVNKSTITNSLYAAQALKDGIADYFRNKFGKRPNVNVSNPDVRFNLHIEKNFAIVSLDTSGDSLHKRGYRLLAGEAPMQETLAAAIIKISNWDGENQLWDCMCGSGTILCEAVMSYCRIPAQYLRKNFGFFYLPDFEKELWMKIKSIADGLMRPLPKGLIRGSDVSQRVIVTARENLSRIPYTENVEIFGQPFQHIKSFENGTLITNPPYGIRLGKIEDVQLLYKELGDFLKNSCKGTSAFIYMGDVSLRKHIGLRTSKRIPLVNGNLEGVLVNIESYEGSKKRKYRDNEKNDFLDA